MENTFLETERLILRRMKDSDFAEIATMLKNPEVMYAWEHDFEDIDVMLWIKKNREFYGKYGLGYFLAIDKLSGEVIGQIALMPDIIDGVEYLEVGYILKPEFWGMGYAQEGAKAVSSYAFRELGKKFVIFEIRPENKQSRKVAERLGGKVDGQFVKNVQGKEMIHLIYKLFMID